MVKRMGIVWLGRQKRQASEACRGEINTPFPQKYRRESEAKEMLGYKHSGFSVDTSVCIAVITFYIPAESFSKIVEHPC